MGKLILARQLTTPPTLISNVKLTNFYPLDDIETMAPRPMPFVTGEDAHSRDFSEEAYKLTGEPKEFFVAPGAENVNFSDRVTLIPSTNLTAFFKRKPQ